MENEINKHNNIENIVDYLIKRILHETIFFNINLIYFRVLYNILHFLCCNLEEFYQYAQISYISGLSLIMRL